jgi:nucleoside-diphosphate-sugar epimerase
MTSGGAAGGHHALVLGASGINGWAVVNQILLGYPAANVFSRVSALTNRPLSQEVSQWPKSDKLNIVSGLDLLKGSQTELQDAIKSRVESIETVTHVYFFAYIIDEDPAKEVSINVDLLKRAVSAVEALSSKLQFVVLPTGTKVKSIPKCETPAESNRRMECISFAMAFPIGTICH